MNHNDLRAQRARASLTFIYEEGHPDASLEENIIDAISDMLHLAGSQGDLDVQAIARMAMDHYSAEIQDETSTAQIDLTVRPGERCSGMQVPSTALPKDAHSVHALGHWGDCVYCGKQFYPGMRS